MPLSIEREWINDDCLGLGCLKEGDPNILALTKITYILVIL